MTLLLFAFFGFMIGLIIGSFLNCVIYRIEQKESFVKGRSYCPYCKHSLGAADLIPLVSFLWLKGKCRYCSHPISWQYPVVELATGFLFFLVWHLTFTGFTWPGVIGILFLWYIASVFIVIFVYDLKHYIIPDSVLIPAIVVTVLYELIFTTRFLVTNSLWAGVAASAFFALIFFISKGAWMGFGDVKLAILLGLLLGFPGIFLGMFLAFTLGALVGIVLMSLQKKGLKSEVPFAPFLLVGTSISLLWGPAIIGWYTATLVLP